MQKNTEIHESVVKSVAPSSGVTTGSADRNSYLATIKAKIDNGNYHISASALAEALISEGLFDSAEVASPARTPSGVTRGCELSASTRQF